MTTARKPLMLFYLVHMRGVSNALVFTKSASSTARLVKLFEFFEEAYRSDAEMDVNGQTISSVTSDRIITHAYSSDLPPGERKTILEKFRKQEIQMYAYFPFFHFWPSRAQCLFLSVWCVQTSLRGGLISLTSRMSFRTMRLSTYGNTYTARAGLLVRGAVAACGHSLRSKKHISSRKC